MKKMLLASIVLMLCSLSILIFQLSCTKTVQAQTSGSAYTLPPATTSTLGGVIVGTGLAVSSNGTLSTTPTTTGLTRLHKLVAELGYAVDSVLIMNDDGSNPSILTLPVPAGQMMAYEGQDVVMSPDGKTLFFQTYSSTPSVNTYYFYSCNVDGSGRKLIYTSGPNPATPLLVGAY